MKHCTKPQETFHCQSCLYQAGSMGEQQVICVLTCALSKIKNAIIGIFKKYYLFWSENLAAF